MCLLPKKKKKASTECNFKQGPKKWLGIEGKKKGKEGETCDTHHTLSLIISYKISELSGIICNP